MLKDRFKQWQINTKNRRPVSKTISICRQTRSPNPSPPVHSECGQRKVVAPAAPPIVNLEQSKERHLLHELNCWYERAWHHINFSINGWYIKYDGIDQILDDVQISLDSAVYFNSERAWRFLRKFEDSLQNADWQPVRPRTVTQLLAVFVPWQPSSSAKGNNVRVRVVKLLQWMLRKSVVNSFGSEHPIALLINMALHRQIGLDICQHIASLEEHHIRQSAPSSQKTFQIECAKIRSIRNLYELEECEALENLTRGLYLQSDALRTRYFCFLGLNKHVQGKYPEAGRLFFTAYNESTDLHSVFQTAECYFVVLLDQGKAVEAARTVLTLLRRLKVNHLTSSDTIYLEWFTYSVRSTYSEQQLLGGDCSGMDEVLAQIAAIRI